MLSTWLGERRGRPDWVNCMMIVGKDHRPLWPQSGEKESGEKKTARRFGTVLALQAKFQCVNANVCVCLYKAWILIVHSLSELSWQLLLIRCHIHALVPSTHRLNRILIPIFVVNRRETKEPSLCRADSSSLSSAKSIIFQWKFIFEVPELRHIPRRHA